MPNRNPLTLRLPLLEVYPSGPTRMQVQKQYEAIRAGGKSVQQAIRDIEDIFDIYKVAVDSSGKTVVNFKINEDAFTDALSKFTGMKFDACKKCGELLAHRGGKPLPCTNPKCSLKGQPVSETWYANAHDRAEAEKDWIGAHPGFQFGVYVDSPTIYSGTLVSTHPSLSVARREARKLIGKGKRVRIKDVRSPDRSYWHEETEEEHLKESAPTGTLLAAIQKELPNVRSLVDIFGKFDAQAFKFEMSVARRIKDTWVSVVIDGKRILLPVEQGEELVKFYNSNMRGLKKYVNSRW